MIKNIIEDNLWYDGGVYPVVDNTDQVSYVTTGTRMGSYTGNVDWLKIKSVYAYKDYTITLTPGGALTVAAPDGNNNIVLTYISATSTQTEIADKLAESAYITSATAENGSGVVTSDTSVGTLKCGKFRVKRKEGAHIGDAVEDEELYNIQCESDTEENIKDMLREIRKLSNKIMTIFSYVYDTVGYPYWVHFGDGDDKRNEGNNDFIITLDGIGRW